jgi:arsenate reductase-like glutaredoxin family protein
VYISISQYMKQQNKGIIYLVQPAELVGTNRYKVGYSGKPNLDRVKKGYKKGTRYLYIGECARSKELENKIKAIFNEKFTLIAGYEYFEGDEYEVLETFCREVWDHMKLCYEDESDDDSCDETDDETDDEDDIIEIVVKRKAREKKRPRVVVRKKVQVGVPKTKYQCNNCKRFFTRQENLDYHTENNACKERNFKCKYCDEYFTTSNNMYRHMKHTCDVKKQMDENKDNKSQLKQLLDDNKELDERLTEMERIINNETDSESDDN